MIQPDKILVIQLRRIGDVILTIPAVENLRNHFPHAQIDFLVEPAGGALLRGHPMLNHVHVYDKAHPIRWINTVRNMKYDWVLDFLGNPRSAVLTALSGARVKAGYAYPLRGYLYNHRAPIPSGRLSVIEFKLRLLAFLGLKTRYCGPAIYVTDAEIQKARAFIHTQSGAQEKAWIGIVPTHRRATRRWPPAYFAELGDRLMEKHHMRVMLFWGPGEEKVVGLIADAMRHKPVVTPLLGLRDMAALIGQCHVLISNCNGPKHIAEALNIPTLTMYGPTDPVSWEAGNVVQSYCRVNDLSCIGCNQNECARDLLCMKRITPRVAEHEFEKLLARINNKPSVIGAGS